MTPKQFAELLEYVKENNCWGAGMYEVVHVRHRRAVKYVRASFDSRDGAVWSISLDEGGGNATHFRIENEIDIEKLYAYLDAQIS